ncbi:MAG: hypothetical protein RQ866_03805, partial [Bacteroidales bacterium]|nr:hypothetical protein [Bacteroidales bacterium]
APPVTTGMVGSDRLNKALAAATGIHDSSTAIMKSIKKGSTIVFEDLELWWTRSDNGDESVLEIINLINQYGARHLFMLDCNIHFYRHISKYSSIEDYLLATVFTSGLKISDVQKIILNRHSSGGMQFLWRGIKEEQLNSRQMHRLFHRITATSDGNIGMAFYLWLGEITDVNQTTISFGAFEKKSLPVIDNPDWENMLIQILMHKKINLFRLKQVYTIESELLVVNTLQSLIRAGLVVKTTAGRVTVNPYVVPYLLKYLRKKFEV